MGMGPFNLDTTFHRPSGTVVATVRVRFLDDGDADRVEDTPLWRALFPLLGDPAVKQTVVDLRAVGHVTGSGFRGLIRLHREANAVGKRLILLAGPPSRREIESQRLDQIFDLAADPTELKERYQIELPAPDEPVTFTEAELREMEADGLTLGAAIRALETRPG